MTDYITRDEEPSIDRGYVPPDRGGCWICHRLDGTLDYDGEFDAFFHPDCLPNGVDTILEYERGED